MGFQLTEAKADRDRRESVGYLLRCGPDGAPQLNIKQSMIFQFSGDNEWQSSIVLAGARGAGRGEG